MAYCESVNFTILYIYKRLERNIKVYFSLSRICLTGIFYRHLVMTVFSSVSIIEAVMRPEKYEYILCITLAMIMAEIAFIFYLIAFTVAFHAWLVTMVCQIVSNDRYFIAVAIYYFALHPLIVISINFHKRG